MEDGELMPHTTTRPLFGSNFSESSRASLLSLLRDVLGPDRALRMVGDTSSPVACTDAITLSQGLT